ncbi:MAG: molybdopterin-guanine dinucleotide biosynthesis protein B, partial [Firmicutes bacterium]|nr:molybdopterin-guanine dinucleotide biosynthesis protein B [Bacillota bacterium]
MPPVILNIVAAQSKTGKTTLMEKLLPELSARGLKVAALKGEVHQYNLDIPGKDTWRFAQAGAAVVGMTTPEKYILIGSASAGGTAAAVARLQDFDLILIEGAKKSPYPKIEVVRSAVSSLPLLSQGVIAIATDMADLQLPHPLPLFPLDDPAGLANFICNRFFRPSEGELGLTHFDREGRPRMVDVSEKENTSREAYAAGEIIMAPATLGMIKMG